MAAFKLSYLDSEKTPSESSRYLVFDLLKTIGILCIMLAHTMSKNNVFVYQLRNFDVPLMVMVSGALFNLTSASKKESFISYFKKRFLRLIVPVWTFFIFFFMISFPISYLEGRKYPFQLKEIFYSFALLIGGVGYVWIIRVFILIVLLSPLILFFKRKIASDLRFLLSLIPICLFSELAYNAVSQIPKNNLHGLGQFLLHNIVINFLLNQTFFLLLPYGCLFAFGMTMMQINKKYLFGISMTFFSIFIVLSFSYAQQSGNFFLTQDYKYPPRLYYLSYSIFMSLLLYLLGVMVCNGKNNLISRSLPNKFISFVGRSSLWIYLWHIFFIYYSEFLFKIFHFSFDKQQAFIIIPLLSIATTYLQKIIVSWIMSKLNNRRFADLLKMALLT